MNLWEIWQLLETICNKDYEGNIITPERYKSLLKVASLDLFRKKYGLPEGYQPGRPVPVEHVDITIKNTDDMKAFKMFMPNTPVTNGILPFPADYAHYEDVRYNYIKSINGVNTTIPKPVEILKEGQLSERRGNWTKSPSTKNPVGVVRRDGIHVYPSTISAVDFHYYRFPKDPVFSYNQGDGYITYNATASIELEFPKDESLTIAMYILSYLGVNLRESDLVQFAELKKRQGE